MKNGLKLVAGADGAVEWGDQFMIDPTKPKGQTWAVSAISMTPFMGCSARTVDVALTDLMACGMKPYVRELPEAFFELMTADLNGPLAEDYRGYIRHEIKPVLDLITDTLLAHYAVIEPPPLKWLLETFTSHSNMDKPTQIVDAIVAYSRAWTRVLAEWDTGRLDSLHPPNHMMPLGAVTSFFLYSRKLGQAKRE